MKYQISKLLTVLVVSIFMFAGLAACSGQRYGKNSENTALEREKIVDRISHWLTLDDIQKQRLIVAVETMEVQRKAITDSSRPPRLEAMAFIAGTTFDRDGAQTILKEKLMTLQSGGPAVVIAIADFYDVLKPEQQQKIRDAFQNGKTWRTFRDNK